VLHLIISNISIRLSFCISRPPYLAGTAPAGRPAAPCPITITDRIVFYYSMKPWKEKALFPTEL